MGKELERHWKGIGKILKRMERIGKEGKESNRLVY